MQDNRPYLTENGRKLLEKRYLLRNPDGEIIETPRQMFERVAACIAEAEEKYGSDSDKWYNIFLEKLLNLELMVASPYLFNCRKPGEGKTGNLLSCFVVDLYDSIDGIYNCIKECAIIYKASGGIGINLSALREEGARVGDGSWFSSGALSFLEVMDKSAAIVANAGNRRSASMAMLDVDHPDILKFIRIKSSNLTEISKLKSIILNSDDESIKSFAQHQLDSLQKITKFNLSVKITDAFMKAVDDDDDWNLISPHTKKVTQTLKARKIFNEICKNAWRGAEPGVAFIDTMNKDNACPNLGRFETTNPCGEQALLPYGSCNLTAVNLNKCIINNEFSYEKLSEVTKVALRICDNAIDVSDYPLDKIRDMAYKTRNAGVGIMGVSDVLIKLGIVYGSEEACIFLSEIAKTMREAAIDMSMQLAKERGVFPAYEGSTWQSSGIKIRNSRLLTSQPTGSIAIIANASHGIEPLFSVFYQRKLSSGETFIELNELFKDAIEKAGLNINEIIEKIKVCVGIQKVIEIPQHIKDIFKCAYDITPEQHVKMQAAYQKYNDSSTSKCVSEGTLIQTNYGLMPVENFGNAKVGMFGDILHSGLKVLSHDNKWHTVTKHYNDGVKDTIKVRCDNGATIEGSFKHKIMTLDGWQCLSELNVGDFVVTSVIETNKSNGSQKLPSVVYEHNKNKYKDFVVPKNMSENLALLLGMLCSDGHLQESTGLVSICGKNRDVGEKYCKLFNLLFGVNPKERIDKRNGVLSWEFNSIPLCLWIKNIIGYRSYNKHVPEQILMGSVNEQLQFLSGLSLDGYRDKRHNDTYVYSGRSQRLAKEVFNICVALGMTPHLGERKVKGYNYSVYIVKVGQFCNCIENFKNSHNKQSEYYVRLPSIDILKQYCPKPDKNDSKYITIMRWIRTHQKITKNTALERYGIPYDKFIKVVKITSIQQGKAHLYDIEVEDSHSYLVNGIISHNTVNLPSNSTIKDVENVYRLAHKLGCKGITVFRDGCKPGVLNINDGAINNKYNENFKNFLYNKYCNEKLTAKEIADILSVSEQVIFAKLKRYGIRKKADSTSRAMAETKLTNSLRETILANIMVGHSKVTVVGGQSSFRLVSDHKVYAEEIRREFLERGVDCNPIMTIVTDKTYFYFDTVFNKDIFDLPIDENSVITLKDMKELLTPNFVRHLFLVGGSKTGKGGIKFCSNNRNGKVLNKFMKLLQEKIHIDIVLYDDDSCYVCKNSSDAFCNYLESSIDITSVAEEEEKCPECGTPLIAQEKCKYCPNCQWSKCSL